MVNILAFQRLTVNFGSPISLAANQLFEKVQKFLTTNWLKKGPSIGALPGSKSKCSGFVIMNCEINKCSLLIFN